jgi:hypothetical protein
MANYRLYPSASGPSTVVSYSGPYMAGILFQVTTGGMWFEGYWWWVGPSGQPTAAQTFALWQVSNVGTGVLVSSATATSGTLTPGQWNYVPLTSPIPLSIGVCYNASTGLAGSFPDTPNSFGAGDIYSAGITNGPLAAYSDQSGTAPAPFSMSQGVFSVSGSDPTVLMPANGNSSSNLWMDLQVTDQAPSGTSYRLWPNYPVVSEGARGISTDTFQETFGTEFLLSQSCTLDKVWFYSPPGVSVLPDATMIWDVSTQQIVAGTEDMSPAWTGTAGSGWVSNAYSGITLPPGDYITSVYTQGGNETYTELPDYFGGGGPASAAGIVNGPLSSPNVANASPPGNSRYQIGGVLYPDSFDTHDEGETRWVDIEVTPATGTNDPPPPPPPPVNSGAFLTFFP